MGPTPYWSRSFQRRDPLTMRVARTLAETSNDPYDYIEGPEPRRRTTRDRLCWAAAVALILWLYWAVAHASLHAPG